MKRANSMSGGLVRGFFDSLQRFPERNALMVGGEAYTYAALGRMVAKLADAIQTQSGHSNPLAALLADRSITAYAGCLGILASGRGYVPLNTKLPAERMRKVLALSRADVLVVGKECLGALEALLSAPLSPLLVIAPDSSEVHRLQADYPQHRFAGPEDLSSAPTRLSVPAVSGDAVAYLLFTSGSTGEPKGVGVTQRNVAGYIENAGKLYAVTEHDRFSQMFDMSFDLSVHDMFLCWEHGACLYSVPTKIAMGPARFISDHALTMWFSVPSVAGFMLRMNMLKPGCFPSLRYSLFCGEPLPVNCAKAWQEAAPNSVIENLYGPTEATIAFTRYRWDPEKSPGECLNGIVPIGLPFDGQRVSVIDENRDVLGPDQAGELCLSGTQVTPGYWNAPEKTAEQFVRLKGQGESIWYRTGDLVTRDGSGCLRYLGRLDSQIKVRGYRVELQEIDWVLRRASGTDDATAIAWPVRDGTADGIVAFVGANGEFDESRVLARCRQKLPDYMVPARIYKLPSIPLNINGKIDRSSLVRLMEAKHSE